MAHAHHHNQIPTVVEGRTGVRRGAAFIIGGLTSGHGVFHWIAQSFIVVLPEVRDLLLGGSVIAATSIQSTREIASGVVSLPGGVITDALRRYWGWVMAVCMGLFGVGWLLMAAAGWQVPGKRVAGGEPSLPGRRGAERLEPCGLCAVADRYGSGCRCGGVLAFAGDGRLVVALCSPAGIGALVSRRRRQYWRRRGPGADRASADQPYLASGDHHLRRRPDIPHLPRLLGFSGHRTPRTSRGSEPTRVYDAQSDRGDQAADTERPDVGHYGGGRVARHGLHRVYHRPAPLLGGRNWG